MSSITIPCENPGQVSDGFHTFDELYEHRTMLFFALMRAHPERAWRSLRHADGSRFEDYFICGINLSSGPVTYHCPVRYWTLLDGLGIETLERAPEWDGHTSRDVVERLRAWVVDPAPHDESEAVSRFLNAEA